VHAVWQSGHPCDAVPEDADVSLPDLPRYLARSCASGGACIQEVNVSLGHETSSGDAVAVLATARAFIEADAPLFRMNTVSNSKRTCGSPIADAYGHIAPRDVQRVTRAGFGPMRECYERGLTRNAALTGKVAVRFVITREGGVRDAAIDDMTTMPDPDVASCVLSAFLPLVFPKPEGGPVTVAYPIIFFNP
jgi:hypothetical protein